MAAPAGEFQLDQYIMYKMSNQNYWDIPFLPRIQLPEFLSAHALMLFICVAFLTLVFVVFRKKDTLYPKGITNFLEIFVQFIRDDIAVPSLGKEDGVKMTPLFCSFFFYILTLNIMGLIPLFKNVTANINVTAGLALITLFFMIFGAIYKNGFAGFFNALKPSGVPVPILFILMPIEFIGLFIKAFALMIRLFANMLAGSIVVYSLVGLVVVVGYAALPSVLLAVFITLLKVLVSFIQAYVFTLLSALFIGQVYHPEH